MRVITGMAKGKRLKTLEGQDVRPTTERVKEAVFSIIQFDIEGRVFLDLFSGSGQMGIEALSRGAKSAVFIDSKRESINVIKQNLDNTGLSANAKVLNTDSLAFISREQTEKFDLAFLDPPYNTGLLQKALPLTALQMKKTGTIICERPIDEEIPQKIHGFTLDRNYRYGKIMISTYRYEDVTEE
ncbi:MAG: 16S rRNA (guanine(966)-N(2))-methyltransferase RsmD [Acutalibacteraceae bacterium]|nr:16S rRNA (guanine(966)-N(2))-methyltransferase RsmD [Acutalibacteraceae bacterium]